MTSMTQKYLNQHLFDAIRLSKNPLIDKNSVKGWTVFHGAEWKKHCLDLVRLSIDAGADVNTTDDSQANDDTYGSTPLHWAVICGQLEIVQLLIKNGAKVDIKASYDYTALHYAGRYGHTEIATELLDEGADIKAENHVGSTPLHEAVEYKMIETARLFIEKGSPINARDNWGETPLFKAGSSAMIHLLIENGAKIGMLNKSGETVLQVALSSDPNCIAIAKVFIEKGVDVHNADERGWTALHMAASYDFEEIIEIIEILLAKGVRVKRLTKEGRTALCLAKQFERPEVIKILQQAMDREAA